MNKNKDNFKQLIKIITERTIEPEIEC